jgi:hypothetical protein
MGRKPFRRNIESLLDIRGSGNSLSLAMDLTTILATI